MSGFVTVIACGGQSSRFGKDKAFASLGGTTLLKRSLTIAKGYGAPVAIAGSAAQSLEALATPLLKDRYSLLGPISALQSAMNYALELKRSHVLLVACDQPFLPADLPHRLMSAIGDHGAAVPVSRGRAQYMSALWRTDVVSVQRYIAAEGRSLRRFADKTGAVEVAWEGAAGSDPFADIDDEQSLADAERRCIDWRETK